MNMNTLLTTIWSTMQMHAIWILVAIVLVTFAMLVDLLTGIRKANRNGSATTSNGLRKTCEKACKYYLPIICGAMFDLLFSPLSFYTLPFMTMFIAAYCIFCEVKSVMENTRSQDEVQDMAKFITNVIKKKENSTELVEELLKNLTEEDLVKVKATATSKKKTSKT